MNIVYRKEYSPAMGKDMEFKTFGHSGKIMFVFPPQDGRFWDYEDFGMIDVVAKEIEEGRLFVVLVDGNDWDSWTCKSKGPRERIESQERWFTYVTQELLPRVKEINPGVGGAISTGVSMGATHAANFFFRRPDLFDTLIAQSGLYEGGYFFGDYMDDLVYANSPVDFLANMPADHYYMDLYKNDRIIISVGQGAWEDELLESTRKLDTVMASKGIPAWFDYWGLDVNHDWPWWKKQMRYFMDKIMYE